MRKRRIAAALSARCRSKVQILSSTANACASLACQERTVKRGSSPVCVLQEIDTSRLPTYKMNMRRISSAKLGIALCLSAQILSAGQPPLAVPRGEPIGGPPANVAAPPTNSPASGSDQKPSSITNAPTGQEETAFSKDSKFVVAGFDKLAGFNIETGPDSPV